MQSFIKIFLINPFGSALTQPIVSNDVSMMESRVNGLYCCVDRDENDVHVVLCFYFS